MAAKASWHRNHVTVALCIPNINDAKKKTHRTINRLPCLTTAKSEHVDRCPLSVVPTSSTAASASTTAFALLLLLLLGTLE